MVKASSGRSSLLMRTKDFAEDGLWPDLTARMAEMSAVFTRGLAVNFELNSCRQLGHAFFLALVTRSWKHFRQKLCWQGA